MQGGNAQNKKRFIIVSLILILSLALPCFAAYVSGAGNAYSVYNQMTLRNISDVWTDQEAYPYAYVHSNGSGGQILFLSSSPLVTRYSNTYLFPREDCTYLTYEFYLSSLRGWENRSEGSLSSSDYYGFTPAGLSSVWSSYDILSLEDGTVWLAGSDPISLSGYVAYISSGSDNNVMFESFPDLRFLSVASYGPQFDPFISNSFDAFVGLQSGSSYSMYPYSSFSSSNDLVFASGSLGSDSYYGLFPVGSEDDLNSCLCGILKYGDSTLICFNSNSSFYTQLFAYRESETEGPTGAVTGLNIITPPLGETDYIVYAGSELQCTAQVTGTGDFNPAVTWSLSHSSSSSEYYPTISETGLLSVLPGVPEQRIFITATSVADPSIYATVPVYIMLPAVSSVTITPSSATAAPGQNVQFSATVFGSNVEDSAVTWAVGGASSASTRITRDGLLLIGSDEVSPVIAVRATSDQDGSVYGSALVTINVPAAVTGVTITPDDVVLNRGDVQQFTATVSGTGSYDNSVTWQITSVYSAGTSISNTGLLAIGEEQKYDYIIIKATSTTDPSLSATAYVFVEDALSDPMNIDLSVVERLLEEIKNYLKTLQHIFDRPHYFREFNMYTGKLNEQEEQITGLTFNFYRFMQNMEEYVGSIAYTFANGAEVQIREDTTEGFDWFSLFFGKDSGSKVEKSDFAGISTIVTNTRDLFDTGFGFSDFFELIGSVPFFTDEVGSQLDTTIRQFDARDPDPFNMSVLGNRDEQLEEWRNKHTD